MKRKIVSLSLLMSLFLSFQAFSAGKPTVLSPSTGGQVLDEETRKRVENGEISGSEALSEALERDIPESLLDDVIEFSEIKDLIDDCSIIARMTDANLQTVEKAISGYTEAIDDAVSVENDYIKDLQAEKKDTKDTDEKKLIQSEIDLHKAYIKNYNKTRKIIGISSLRDTVIKAKNSDSSAKRQMTKAIEDAFLNAKMLEETVSLYSSLTEVQKLSTDMTERMGETGMATDTDTVSARVSFLETENTLKSYENTLKTVKYAIFQTLGFKNEDFDILKLGDVPEYTAFIGERNLEEDIKTCEVNNTDYSSAMKIGEIVSNSGYQAAAFSAEQNIRLSMTKFYDSCLEAEKRLESARISEKLSILQKEKTERYYAQGLVGNAEYKGSLLNAVQAEMNAEISNIQALQAKNDYMWGLLGQI